MKLQMINPHNNHASPISNPKKPLSVGPSYFHFGKPFPSRYPTQKLDFKNLTHSPSGNANTHKRRIRMYEYEVGDRYNWDMGKQER
jgi:hypothetical protein